MKFPLVSRDRYHEMLALHRQRIADLEAERRILWDKICLLGIGAPIFAPISQSKPVATRDGSNQPPPNIRIGSMRPRTLMRRMDRVAEDRWLRR